MILFWISMISMGFVIIKAGLEIVQTSRTGEVEKSEIHANQHMVYLLTISLYEVVNTITYICAIFDMEPITNVQWLLFIKINFLNLIFLLIINHFKQERLKKVGTLALFDIFKFH